MLCVVAIMKLIAKYITIEINGLEVAKTDGEIEGKRGNDRLIDR